MLVARPDEGIVDVCTTKPKEASRNNGNPKKEKKLAQKNSIRS
jgi:hypothetical protein